jgi:hypothetical protein
MGDVMPYFALNAQPVNGFVPNALPGNAMGFNCSQVMDLPMTDDQGMPPGNVIGFDWGVDGINSGIAINASGAPIQNGLPFGGMPMQNAFGLKRFMGAGTPLGGGRVFDQQNSSVAINASAVLAIGEACGVDEIGIKLPAPANDIEISGIEKASAGAADFQDGLSMRFAFMHPVGVNFAVGDNATLSLQFPGEDSNQTALETGYVLAPGAAVTFGYDGKLVIGHGTTPDASLNDSSYVITVMTSKGVAQANVTSS